MLKISEKVLKEKQLNIILKANPMEDDYHTGIRKIEDIKLLKECDPEEGCVYTDYKLADYDKMIQTKKCKIYSSHPIKVGTFVTPSLSNAKDYAGNGKIFNKECSIFDIAWIESDEGIYCGKVYE